MTSYGDKIIMEGMVFHGHVGVLDFEKANGQSFVLDITFYCRQIDACSTDRLDQTVDYSQAYELARSIVEQADCDLIERLAGILAEAMLKNFPLALAVEITVRKPQAPIQGEFKAMGVQIIRERG